MTRHPEDKCSNQACRTTAVVAEQRGRQLTEEHARRRYLEVILAKALAVDLEELRRRIDVRPLDELVEMAVARIAEDKEGQQAAYDRGREDQQAALRLKWGELLASFGLVAERGPT